MAKKHGIFLGLTARFLMMIAGGLLVLSYLSIFVNPAKAWWMTIFGLLFIPLLLLNIFLLVWAIIRGSKALIIPFLALLPAVFIMKYYYGFNDVDPEEEGNVKIVTYNVGKFSTDKLGLENEDCTDSVAAFLKTQNADIICMQEFWAPNEVDIKEWLTKNFPGYTSEYFVYTNSKGRSGNVTLSRFPTVDKGVLDFENSTNLAVYSEYEIDGKRMRVYNCHFESYNLSLPYLVKTFKGDYRKAVRETEAKMKRSLSLRPRQVQQVLDDILSSPTDAIIMGDFNDTPLSYTYRRLSRGHEDTFVKAGKGFGATYSAFKPFLRIDFILYPKSGNAVRHEVLQKKYSDHYPVVAEIKI